MDLAHDFGPREHEHIVVAAEVARMVAEAVAAKVRFRQPVPLHHRPHRAIKDENPLREECVELESHVTCHRRACPVDLSPPCGLCGFVLTRRPVAGFTPDATSTVNGSPALRAPTATRTA